MLIFNQVSKNGICDLSFYIRSGEFAYIYYQESRDIETLFNLIMGNARPDDGVIRWLNNDSLIKPFPIEKRVVYQENILLPDRTVIENMRYIMQIRGFSSKYINNRARRVLNILELDKLFDKKPGELMKHQLIRANIAQAILDFPTVVIVENPTIMLDDVNAQGIIHLLKGINSLSLTIIFLSSDQRLIPGDGVKVIGPVLTSKQNREKGSYA
ncbi:ATP-binding cassette domain-containing protein [Iocasia frigidifontis]|uniref:ATP-binding cassette domain-containing protein n=1 Tax=Iocasia fonsfrigidae TaxID=2682810 RepID=A0A8A7KA83_9FIRM|nr:ATP-binding cassette domain-containing protein [Iocasia fonsfrigidae]QTL97005.1 ATP-binding cassette domain-containing protein [Iocasia fonsfrigidae]